MNTFIAIISKLIGKLIGKLIDTLMGTLINTLIDTLIGISIKLKQYAAHNTNIIYNYITYCSPAD